MVPINDDSDEALGKGIFTTIKTNRRFGNTQFMIESAYYINFLALCH